ncbi:DNA-binding response regulator, OmpR family, contains REC and winged-helix (wHTH) domain [Arthrobacter sp. ok909]|jgi:DNA-binding response OmpR family regulator|uniref:response regulator transcription factor n=1 Tax=Arthrobacter sp. ok909 TaxID=1761746 RepID=UPI0008887C7B|nr:response regulator transcription factor [Arthrobacter sp. ok909]SDP37476.1 DNA-binding response regulator, OmpR family, contains REC and winged-helix (wHTH) domain [Arthrobacter sp. ok909]
MTDLGVAVVVEDDEDVRNLVEAVLSQAGFDVHGAASGREGVEVVRSQGASVVTLDVGLNDIDGYEVLRRIRQFSDAYVVMLTARTDELDTLTALHTGADDFMTKPFRPRELRARVAAMMRRPRQEADDATSLDLRVAPSKGLVPPQDAEFRHNGLVLNPHTRLATVDGIPTNLTRSEFDLLHALLKGAGAVRTKTDLVRVVRGEHYSADAYISDSDERAVEVHIGNLRRKLHEDPLHPRWLQTVRGVGYRITPPLD